MLLHGTSDFPNHRFLFPLIARRCNGAGFNAATLELPYHFQRYSHEPGGLDYFRWAESIAQGVAEIRALTGWLLGCSPNRAARSLGENRPSQKGASAFSGARP